MLSTVGYIMIGAIIGIVCMIIISVLVVSGRQSDEEYERDLKEYMSSIEGSDGLERKDK